MFNNGKQERKYHEFLGKKYRIDALPCGISIPFTVELNKLRKKALEIVFNIDPKTPRTKVFKVMEKYLDENPEEAQAQMLQMIKALSVITEFMTDGAVSEEVIKKEASDDDIGSFIDAIQEAQYDKTIKKLKGMKKNFQ